MDTEWTVLGWTAHGMSMCSPLGVRGASVACLRPVRGASIDSPWGIHGYFTGQSVGYPWTIHGAFVDSPWEICGQSVERLWIVYP